MKVCEKCGDEISTKDGENRCKACTNRSKKNAANQRKAYNDVLKSLGMVKVRGALGGTYWE
jgi:uncharacterized membrane protein YvbJ